MIKQLFKYFLIFIVIIANLDKFSGGSKNSTKTFTVIFIIAVIYIILKLFKQSNKHKKFNKPQSEIYSSPTILKKDLIETEFKNKINSQLNFLLKKRTEIFWVGDEHRAHPWSIEPGGSTVVVLFKDQKCIGYDKVKRPDRYTRKISTDYISNNFSNKQYNSLEQYIKSIYLAKDRTVELKKIWDTNTNLSPWELLEKYRIK
jgi:uncharacterized membrane protein YtjA (UPF0391 family)